MKEEFWNSKWQDNQIGFHLSDYHPELIKYLERLGLSENESILVPLCGKTKDMIYLSSKGYQVTGAEFSSIACESFFKESNLQFSLKDIEDFKVYAGLNHELYCGDYFLLSPNKKFKGAYDRAAIVALDPSSRKKYADQYSKLIEKDGKILLLSFEYDQSKVNGPPFSVDQQSIETLFTEYFHIEVLEEKPVEIKSPKFIEVGLDKAIQKAYILTRK